MVRSLLKLYLVLILGVAAGLAAIDHVLVPAYHQQLSETEREREKATATCFPSIWSGTKGTGAGPR
ncbi:hypothetical protein ACU4GI_25840 [Cupriavidus basilensis]